MAHRKVFEVINNSFLKSRIKGYFCLCSNPYNERKYGNSSGETHFGYQTVKESEKAEKGIYIYLNYFSV